MSAREMVEEMVDEMLDMEGDVVIGGLSFSRSRIVKQLDPIAYRIMVKEYADSRILDLEYDIDQMNAEDDADEIADLQREIDQLEDL